MGSQEEYTEELRYRLAHPQPGDLTPRPGMVAVSQNGQAGMVPFEQLMAAKEPTTIETEWKVPKLQKRTDQERAISLANRLYQAVQKRKPAEMDYVLKEMQTDKWKRGEPVSFEECQQWAAEILKKALVNATKG